MRLLGLQYPCVQCCTCIHGCQIWKVHACLKSLAGNLLEKGNTSGRRVPSQMAS